MQRPYGHLDARLAKLLWGIAAVLAIAAIPMTGCKGFFIPVCQANNDCPTSTTTGTDTGTGTGSARGGSFHAGTVAVSNSAPRQSVIYVADPARQRVQGFSVSSRGLAPMRPFYTAGQTTVAVALSMKTHLLFRATREGVIYIDRIENDGAPAPENRQQAAALVGHPSALAIDGTKNLLFVASSDPASLRVFHVDSKRGTLQPSAQDAISLGPWDPVQMALTLNGQNVFIALGKGGVDGFRIGTNGTLNGRIHISPTDPGVSQDNALAFDREGKYLFVGERGAGIRAFSLQPDGALTGISGSPADGWATGPSALVVSSEDGVLYASYPSLKEIVAYRVGPTGDVTPLRVVSFSSAASSSALSLGIDGAHLFTLAQDGSLRALPTSEFLPSR